MVIDIKNPSTLDERLDNVKNLRKQGYNCSQCVMMSFPDIHGLDSGTVAKLTAACGAGMTSGEICGVASAIAMLHGMRCWNTPDDKAATYKNVRILLDAFRSKFGAMTCRELKAEGRSCNELIVSGIRMLHEELNK